MKYIYELLKMLKTKRINGFFYLRMHNNQSYQIYLGSEISLKSAVYLIRHLLSGHWECTEVFTGGGSTSETDQCG